jgi:prepilin-type N-terminal cleavage/methylation domain-containing protein
MLSHSDQNGFSLAELVITLAVGTIIVITLYGFFSTSINNYFALQQDAVRLVELFVGLQMC